MRILFAAVSVVALMSGAAVAQTAPSTVDKPGAAGQQPSTDPKQTSPGTTGAMQNEPGGVATSPGEVQKQGGASTAPEHKGDSDKSTGGGDMQKPK